MSKKNLEYLEILDFACPAAPTRRGIRLPGGRQGFWIKSFDMC
jgi:hypothetical protein